MNKRNRRSRIEAFIEADASVDLLSAFQVYQWYPRQDYCIKTKRPQFIVIKQI